MKAIVPQEMPTLPDDCTGWARSKRGRGGMYHAHTLGFTACGSLVLDRHKSEPVRYLGDMQFWGVCPRCFRKAN